LRFSILLPTRDRLEYLRHAVETVTRQDYADWELIVSDNCSVDDVAGFVAALDDPRVKYFRTREAVPVTENWNRALDASSGDYVLMLGDDDGLMAGYFRKAEQIIAEFGEPDVVYSRALLLAYPGVIPGHEAGYIHHMGCATFFDGLEEPRLLEPRVARELVRASMELRLRFDFNMQLFTIRRSAIEALRRAGQFFHSPFPDYYAANLLFFRSKRIVIHPDPLAVVGITPKSYGFFHFNKREREGIEFLRNMSGERNHDLERVILPGNRMNTCWLLAMETLADLDGTPSLVPDRRRYRLLQVADSLRRHVIERSMSRSESREVVGALRLWEKAAYGLAAAILFFLTRSDRLRARVLAALDRRLGQYPPSVPWTRTEEYRSLLELFEQAEAPFDPERNDEPRSSRIAGPQ
jgi:glycosyltransferase involved in cell wall biosynthesis